jgi:hypothetical protein
MERPPGWEGVSAFSPRLAMLPGRMHANANANCRKALQFWRAFLLRHCAADCADRFYAELSIYFGGAGVKISRLLGSGFGLGFGAFFASFLPLSLLPIAEMMTQSESAEKGESR